MRVQIAPGLPPAVERLVTRVVAELGPGIAGLPGTLVVGADDPRVPRSDVQRPLAVVPARGPGRPMPWGAALLAAADAVILLDAAETHSFGDAIADRPVVLAGLPAPAPRLAAAGLDVGDAPAQMRRAWCRHSSVPAASGAGVAWVSGRGIAAVTAALEAWAAGRAVIVLPQTDDHELLRLGCALRAHSVAEAVEATHLLLGTPPLAHALGARGREMTRRLPSLRDVALRVLEGVELARQSAPAAAR